MEWVDRIGVAFWVIVLVAVLVVFAVVAWRLIRMAAAARRGDFSTGRARGRAPGTASSRSPSARGSSLRPDTTPGAYLLDDTTPPADAPSVATPPTADQDDEAR
ncbi:hypothetical protein [Herbiconiux flava]|uniref:Uncharacterized protein n=1 Tax=Herbiconiux flava TaxID=881268 RepID=A0A852SS23_9MICO|nr:hypothetical protein [Herbiconiux flava]NYD71768.1 hypothetical protein [Herbiconiux flava]GLK18268.1 hypothetical protein GCM10017602_27500 [Herbiconiux flava]